MNQFENPSAYKDQVIATGLPASPGAAIGQIVFTAEDAEAWNAQGKPAILVQNTEAVDFFFKMHIWQAS
jgi:pyruvate, orthophosphate dikinase